MILVKMKKICRLFCMICIVFSLIGCSDTQSVSTTAPVSTNLMGKPSNNQTVPSISASQASKTPSQSSPLPVISTNLNITAVISSTILPTVVTNNLGPVPENCELGATLQDIAPQYIAPVIGGSPVWVTGFIGPNAKLVFDVANLGGPTEYGWRHKVLWVMDGNYNNPVTISGKNIEDGTPLWFNVNKLSMNPVLDPKKPITSFGNWNGWPSYLYIPKAGCYTLEAVASQKIWKINFAAGRL